MPTFHRVALLALSPKLATVDVRVAVGAFRADVGEHQAHVAFLAAYAGVQPSQRVTRFVMVKLGQVAERTPGTKSVAVFARNVQIAVGASSGGTLTCLAALLRTHPSGLQDRHDQEQESKTA